jgi:hypothetical protein
MEQKTVFRTIDGRVYDVAVKWDENFKANAHEFPIDFSFTDRSTNKALKLPREIRTFTVGDPEETLGDKVEHYFRGNRESMITDYVEMAIRRVFDWVQRGK